MGLPHPSRVLGGRVGSGQEHATHLFAPPRVCHPEAPFFGAEGPMQFAGVAHAADKSIDPFDRLRAGSSARKTRGPQDDNTTQEKGTGEAVPNSDF